jgi:hypothetical protein
MTYLVKLQPFFAENLLTNKQTRSSLSKACYLVKNLKLKMLNYSSWKFKIKKSMVISLVISIFILLTPHSYPIDPAKVSVYSSTSLHLVLEKQASNKSDPLSEDKAILILNTPVRDQNGSKDSKSLPRNWRVADSRFHQPILSSNDLNELRNLNISGSGAFSENELTAILAEKPSEKPLIIDLRQEPHGFLNSYAISWFNKYNSVNWGKSIDEILVDEQTRINKLTHESKAHLNRWNAVDSKWEGLLLPIEPSRTVSEKDLLSKYSAPYLRVPVADHQRPTDQIVDFFVTQIKKYLKSGRWIHFHCAAGKGRTTTFMTMHDMMHHCTKTSFKKILSRQALLGGSDLSETQHPDPKRKDWATSRLRFLRLFYEYCQKEYPNFSQPYSDFATRSSSRLASE